MDVKIGLPSNYIFQASEDLDGNLWMGTDKGLVHLSTGGIKIYDNDNLLEGNYIKKVVCIGRRYVAFTVANKGLYVLDKQYHKVTTILKNVFAFEIYSTSSESFVIVHIQNQKDGGAEFISEFNYKGKLLKHFPIYNDHYTLYNSYRGEEIKVGQNINTSGQALVINSLQQGESVRAYFFNKEYDVLAINNLLNVYKNKKLIFKKKYDIGQYRTSNGVIIHDKLYIHDKMAVHCLDLATQELQLVNKSDELHEISNLSIGKDGRLLVGTLGKGLIIYEQNASKIFFAHLPFVRSYKIISDNIYWLGDEHIYQSKIFNFKNDCDPTYKKYFVGSNVKAFDIKNDTLVYGNFNGLYLNKITPKGLKTFGHFKITSGISGIHFFKTGILYTTFGTGIHFYNLKNSENVRKSSIPFSNIEKSFYLDNLFALSYENGFFSYDDKEMSNLYNKTNKLSSNKVNYIHMDNDLLYVATKLGVDCIKNKTIIDNYQSDEKTEIIYIFKRKNQIYAISNEYLFHLFDGELIPIKKIVLSRKSDITSVIYLSTLDQLLLCTANGMKLTDLSKLDILSEKVAISIGNIIIENKLMPNTEKIQLNSNYKQFSFQIIFPDSLFSSDFSFYYSFDNHLWTQVSQDLIVNLPNLKHGNYEVAIKYINPDGEVKYLQEVLRVKIQPKIYQQWYMIILYVLISSLFTYLAIERFNKRKKRKAAEIQFQLEQERLRISKELHDNIGAYSTAIIENVHQIKNTVEIGTQLENLQNNAKEILVSLRETIWILNHKEMSLQEMSSEIISYAAKILQNYEHIELEVEENLISNNNLPGVVYININRIVKEAIQNAVKHSNCNKIRFEISDKPFVQIVIKDNGKGFDYEGIKSGGYGIENMKQRAKDINYDLSFKIENGCQLTLSSKL